MAGREGREGVSNFTGFTIVEIYPYYRQACNDVITSLADDGCGVVGRISIAMGASSIIRCRIWLGCHIWESQRHPNIAVRSLHQRSPAFDEHTRFGLMLLRYKVEFRRVLVGDRYNKNEYKKLECPSSWLPERYATISANINSFISQKYYCHRRTALRYQC